MTINSRSKGKRMELHCARLLEDGLGIKFERILNQTREKDLADLQPIDCDNFPFILECKHYGKGIIAKPEWWLQAMAAGQKANKYPALLWRYDRQPVRVRVPIAALVGLTTFNPALDVCEQYDWRYTADLDFDTFLLITREILSDVVS